ncbi:hypothetical protein HAX54_021571, partial [Datura stramonium]|nr:hypothetical protein [Datura stramonium]
IIYMFTLIDDVRLDIVNKLLVVNSYRSCGKMKVVSEVELLPRVIPLQRDHSHCSEEIEEKGLKNDSRCEVRRVRESWLGAMAGVVHQPLNFREICTKVSAMNGVGRQVPIFGDENFTHTLAI